MVKFLALVLAALLWLPLLHLLHSLDLPGPLDAGYRPPGRTPEEELFQVDGGVRPVARAIGDLVGEKVPDTNIAVLLKRRRYRLNCATHCTALPPPHLCYRLGLAHGMDLVESSRCRLHFVQERGDLDGVISEPLLLKTLLLWLPLRPRPKARMTS